MWRAFDYLWVCRVEGAIRTEKDITKPWGAIVCKSQPTHAEHGIVKFTELYIGSTICFKGIFYCLICNNTINIQGVSKKMS